MPEAKENIVSKNPPIRLPDELTAELRKAQSIYQARGEKAPSYGVLLLRAWAAYKSEGTHAVLGDHNPPVLREPATQSTTHKIDGELASVGSDRAITSISRKLDQVLEILHGDRDRDTTGEFERGIEEAGAIAEEARRLTRGTAKVGAPVRKRVKVRAGKARA